MSELTEAQCIEYLVHGLSKARGAAKELAMLRRKKGWDTVMKGLDQLLVQGKKLSEARAQTRLQTLSMADAIQQDLDKKH